MHNSLRYTFTIGAAAALLVACGGVSQLPIATPQGGSQFPPSLGSRAADETGKYSLIYAFRPREGASPQTLVYHKGDIFGETYVGGNPSCTCGVVFKLSPVGDHYEYTLLHVFTGGSDDGAYPTSLVATSSGALYGTTAAGGGSGCSLAGYPGCGTIFKLTPTGGKYTYSVLYRFTSTDGGYSPALARDQKISDTSPILGTASGGTGNCGFLFKLVRSGNEYTKHVLWNFGRNPGASGVYPPIVVNGAMYGTASGGFGAYTYAYRFDSGHFTVLRKFPESDAKRDGKEQTLMASDGAGNLYGSALGGSERCFIGKRRAGCGLVFELVAAGGKYAERVLHRFSPGHDGWSPNAFALVYDEGVLYGTTGVGGNPCGGKSDGCGVVFAVSTATGNETVLYRFTGGTRGGSPDSNVVASPNEHVLYDATSSGGHKGAGTVFQLLL